MKNTAPHLPLVVAEDDPDDRLLIQAALEEHQFPNPFIFVEDEEELMEYLYHRGRYADHNQFSRPSMILLDLNMPRKDGREALQEIKCDPHLRQIPVLIFTTSSLYDDIAESYQLGANSFLRKPPTFDGLIHIVEVIEAFWFTVAELPPAKGN